MANNSNQYKSGFDSIGGLPSEQQAQAYQDEQARVWDKLDQLIHEVFEQNEKGKELIGVWEKALIMSPTVTAHSTQFQAGIEEGKKEFIRNIYLTINKVQGE